MAAAVRTLDIKEAQIAQHFPGDPNFQYHHRVLLHKIGAGRWVASTPDEDLEIIDLNAIGAGNYVILPRKGFFPANIANIVYAFDPLPRATLERLRRDAKIMSQLLDDDDPADVALRGWFFADPAEETYFGQAVSDELLDDAVFLGDRGIVELDGMVRFIQEVEIGMLEDWKKERSGSLGDLRTLGDFRDASGRRTLSLAEALDKSRPTEFSDWKLAGPKVTEEYLCAIRDGGLSLAQYHLQWVDNSGTASWSAAAHEHRVLIETLRLALSTDQLDVCNLLSIENLVRRLVQIEVAVARNPMSPDYSGLDVVLEAPVSQGGQATTMKFTEWVTTRLKDVANIQKQARLYKEEFGKATSSPSTVPGSGQGGSGDGGGKGEGKSARAKKRAAAKKKGASEKPPTAQGKGEGGK